MRVKYLKYFVLILLLANTNACLLYGTPDSSIVNVVGRNVDNFVDTTEKQEKVLTLDNDYRILYKQILPNKRSKFALLDTSTGIDEIICYDTQNISINYGFILPDNNLMVFIVTSGGFFKSSFINLLLYDYKRHINVDEKIIVEKNKDCSNPEEKYTAKTGKTADLTPSLVMGNCKSYNKVNYVDFSKDKKYIFIRLEERKNENLLYPEKEVPVYSRKCFQIENNTLIDCSHLDINKYEIAKDVQTGYKFQTSSGNRKSLFNIFPYSDYLPANYKPKYNGLYIHDQRLNKNYLISKNYDIADAEPVWLDDGRMVAYDSKIYDCMGKFKEKKIVDGIIVHMLKK